MSKPTREVESLDVVMWKSENPVYNLSEAHLYHKLQPCLTFVRCADNNRIINETIMQFKSIN